MTEARKVLCILDSLGSGGAQRQMVNLMRGLANRGWRVSLFIYYPHLDFFRAELSQEPIEIIECPIRILGKFGVLRHLIATMRLGQYDAAISFLNGPNLLLELASIFAPRTKIVVSERNSFTEHASVFVRLISRIPHLLANAVVANSRAQADWLRGLPWLRRKAICIRNGFTIKRPAALPCQSPASELKIVGIGRVQPQKNISALIAALNIFESRNGWVPTVTWIGDTGENSGFGGYASELRRQLEAYPNIAKNWIWMGERHDIDAQIGAHHILALPSTYEGFPNVICEAFMLGRVVIASSIGDNAELVGNQERGAVVDPTKPESIAMALETITRWSASEWRERSLNAHRFAVSQFSNEKMVQEYEFLMNRLLEAG